MIRTYIKKWFDTRGWLIRRWEGIPIGVDLARFLDDRQLLSDGILLDVGAHKGETVAYFLEYFDLDVLAFEPVKANFKLLSRRYDGDTKVTTFNQAVGDHCGSLDIVLQADSQTHSLRHRPEHANQQGTEIVEVTTIDAPVEGLSIQKIALLKIDTEGYEVEVLRGAHQALTDEKIEMVFCEVSVDPNDTDHTNLEEVRNFLALYRFHFAGLFDQVAWDSPMRLAYANALFVHE